MTLEVYIKHTFRRFGLKAPSVLALNKISTIYDCGMKKKGLAFSNRKPLKCFSNFFFQNSKN